MVMLCRVNSLTFKCNTNLVLLNNNKNKSKQRLLLSSKLENSALIKLYLLILNSVIFCSTFFMRTESYV